MRAARPRRLGALVLAMGLAVPLTLEAQPPAEPPHDTDYVPPPPVPHRLPATDFVMPDVPDSWNTRTSYDGRLFSTAFSMVPLVDYNHFFQDDDSRQQVGEQDDEWDLRTWRLMVRGRLKFRHPVDYLISLEVKGQDHVQDDSSKIGFTDFEFATELGKLGRLHVGKIKEPAIYEMVGDAANLQQQERALSPFFASRGIGARLVKPFAKDSMSWSVGWYNDWWVTDQSFSRSGNDVAGRLTGVPYWADGGSNYVHLGVSARYIGADEGALRFRGRPESNVSDYYVDSGSMPGDHATELALESAWGRGPFFLTAEYARSQVDADAASPAFWGAYVVASYVLTGEHRPYDKKVAYARRVLPNGP